MLSPKLLPGAMVAVLGLGAKKAGHTLHSPCLFVIAITIVDMAGPANFFQKIEKIFLTVGFAA